MTVSLNPFKRVAKTVTKIDEREQAEQKFKRERGKLIDTLRRAPPRLKNAFLELESQLHEAARRH